MQVIFLCIGMFFGAYALAQQSDPATKSPAEALKKADAKAITKAAAKDRRGTEQQPLIVKVPSDPETQHSRELASSNLGHEAPTDWWLVIPTIVLALFTRGLFFYTALLARATKKLVEGSKDIGERQLRAYVCVERFLYYSHLDLTTGKTWWSIHPIWKNGGMTPTKSLLMNVNSSLRTAALPPSFDFPEAQGETVPMVVGPNSQLTASTVVITGEDLAAVMAGTPGRITKFRVQITHVTGNPEIAYDTKTNVVEIAFGFYRENNCIDEGCGVP